MKPSLLFLFILLFALSLTAQTWNTSYSPPVGYVGPCDSVLIFYPSDSNIWQMGTTSSKIFFGLSGTEQSIMTDSLNPYPANNHSWFDIVLPTYSCYNEEVRFWHKLESTDGKDGGYITWSHDFGVTWHSIFDNDYPDGPAEIGYENLYFPEDSFETSNGYAGYSGLIDTFLFSRVEFIRSLPVRLGQEQKTQDTDDTIIVRFHFVSDSMADGKAGWIIKKLQVVGVDLGGFVQNVDMDNSSLTVTPVLSADGNFTFSLTENSMMESLRIFDASGKIIYSDDEIQSNQLQVKLPQLAGGIYFYSVHLTNNSIVRGKIMSVKN